MTHSRFFPFPLQEPCHKRQLISKAKAPNLVRLKGPFSSVLAYFTDLSILCHFRPLFTILHQSGENLHSSFGKYCLTPLDIL